MLKKIWRAMMDHFFGSDKLGAFVQNIVKYMQLLVLRQCLNVECICIPAITIMVLKMLHPLIGCPSEIRSRA
jgi:hypothetical protein